MERVENYACDFYEFCQGLGQRIAKLPACDARAFGILRKRRCVVAGRVAAPGADGALLADRGLHYPG